MPSAASAAVVPVQAATRSRRLLTPGFASRSKRTAVGPVSESVTARATFLRTRSGASSSRITPGPRRGRLAHLAGRVGEVHQPRAGRRHGHLGHGEHRAVGQVEALRDVAGQLDVLTLVVADRHVRGPVEQDVGGHQHRVGVERRPRHRTVAALLLELDHPVELADVRRALEQVGQLAVRRHPALLEQGRASRVEPDRQHQRPQLRGEVAQQARDRAWWSSRAGRRRRRSRWPRPAGATIARRAPR